MSQPQHFLLTKEPRQIKLPPASQLGGRGCPLPGLHPRRLPTLPNMEQGELYLIKMHQKGSNLSLTNSLSERTPTGMQERKDNYISTLSPWRREVTISWSSRNRLGMLLANKEWK